MLYGIDTPLALLAFALWFAAGIQSGRLAHPTAPQRYRRRVRNLLGTFVAAMAATAAYDLAALTDQSWFMTPDLLWLHLAFTAVPGAAAAAVSLPRIVAARRTDEPAAGPLLVVPPQAAALAAGANLYFLFAPHPILRPSDVAVPVALLVAWTAASIYRHSRRRIEPGAAVRGRVRATRAAVSAGMTIAFIVAWATTAAAIAPSIGQAAPEATHPVTPSSVTTEGDELYFEVRGEGPPLLMISGGGGDAGFYTYVADILADDYEVITYDRRGNSRSTRNFPDSFDISQQARDAEAVIRAAGHESAHVFGNSAGAIIALELAASHPEVLRTVVAHEPPTLHVLPDADKWLGMFASVYRTSFALGPQTANFQFSMSLKAVPFSAFGHTPEGFAERADGNHGFFIRNEMLPFVNYRPDTDAIESNGVDLIMAAGRLTLDTGDYYGRTAPILAAELGHETAVFPGHHIAYFDQPQAWSAALRGLLEDA
ncbi:alpha/beta fold hydrolase [Glycomyces salinus]|uniref:alpha/beta fold hydrolase n=1 Tax=Glycomyces salinus TaxID=980294 RepID=UPI0018EAECE6|nr:alpha/beta hydrolase [Glycomyces salinus]